MARILITSGPTREYLDPIRFISNESSGRMGAALADAALSNGHQVLIVSGPVRIEYPPQAEVINVVTTVELERQVRASYPGCDGIIGVAAPCDFRPRICQSEKIKKTGEGLVIEFEETADILGSVSRNKRKDQWSVGFALETSNPLENARNKLIQKNLDLIVLNGPQAMNSSENHVKVIAPTGLELETSGSKPRVSREIMNLIDRKLVN